MILRRFSAMRRDDARMDLHVHSTFTDGLCSVADIADLAAAAGLTAVAVTDHVRRDSVFVPACFEEIERVTGRRGVRVWKGLEAKICGFDGQLDARPEDVRRADLVVGSVHRFPLGRKLFSADRFSAEIAQGIELELALAAVQAQSCHVLGHPGGMCLRAHGAFPAAAFEEIIAACRDRGVAFELNSSYHGTVADLLADLLARYDPLVSLGSDAHRPDEIGGAWRQWGGRFRE